MKKKNTRFEQWLAKLNFARFARTTRAEQCAAQIEILESRIAPATLVNPTTVTYTDIDGDLATITLSKAIFDATTINAVLHFNTGSVNGSNTAHQQLQLINLAHIGAPAAGTTLTVDAVQAGGGDGFVNVGFIQAGKIDLGSVIVDGDLGRIVAGDSDSTTPGVDGLTVRSIGKLGTTTQQSGGTLVTAIRGPLTSLNVAGDILNANIGVGDPVHKADAQILAINIGGSLIGGTKSFSGAIRATGNIGDVEIDGSIIGGSGVSSGIIGTSGTLGDVTIGGSATVAAIQTNAVSNNGSIIGGAGATSGAILSTGGIVSVHAFGSVEGGKGAGSGQIGTVGILGNVTIDLAFTGGAGAQSGLIVGGSIGDVSIGGSMMGGSGKQSAQISALFGAIGNINVAGLIASATFSANTDIGNITANALHLAGNGISNSSFAAKTGAIGAISATGYDMVWSSSPLGVQSNQAFTNDLIVVIQLPPTLDGIVDSTFTAGGNIGAINATSFTETAISGSTFVAGLSIGNITATAGAYGNGIDSSKFRAAGGSIGIITASTQDVSTPVAGTTGAIVKSAFDAKGNIGDDPADDAVVATGGISLSFFVAGIDLGANFANTTPPTTGTPDPDRAAADFGFGGTGANADSAGSSGAFIGNFNVMSVSRTAPAAGMEHVAILAGVIGSGSDHHFAFDSDRANDDAFLSGSPLGNISAAGSISDVVIEAGAIGFTTTSNGQLDEASYRALDPAGQGIGRIVVNETISTGHSNGLHGSFTSNASIASITVNLAGTRDTNTKGDDAIFESTFDAAASIGDIVVTNDSAGDEGTTFGDGIFASDFHAGTKSGATGGIGNIDVSVTDSSTDNFAIQNSTFDASSGTGSTGDIVTIIADQGDGGASQIVNSTFRANGSIGLSNTIETGNFTNSLITASGNIGNIRVLGDISGSQILAGIDLGGDFKFGGTGAAADVFLGNASIGNVDVTGFFKSSDLIASVNPGTGHVFGDANDSSVGFSSTIGLVTIGFPGGAAGSLLANANATHAIEADSIGNGGITINGQVDVIPGVIDNNSNGIVDAGDVRVQQFGD